MRGYRAEIDGLRAIAVILVVLFHLTLTRLGRGGFIGVDIFFVISGYLITDHLRRDLVDGLSGILEFYRRRIIRIFPALFAVYAACIVLELVINFGSQLGPFQRVLASSTFFGSNFYLYETAGYFDFRSRSNPLIHTWSLSIEEQFYIILPLILYACRRSSTRVQLAWLGGIAAASLVAAEVLLYRDTRISFYLLPLRAWELLAGSLLSGRRAFKLPPLAAELAGLAGVALIFYSAVTLNAQSFFPGLGALPPVMGAVLVIVATDGCRTLIQRALASTPLRFVGQISYSLYLWHWPLIVYARYIGNFETTDGKIALILIAVVLATASWRFIEQPVRRRARDISRNAAFGGAGAAMLTTIVLVLALPALHRLVWTPNPRAESVLRTTATSMDKMRDGTCLIQPEMAATADWAPNCLRIVPGRRNVLILGDSHAAMLWWGLYHRFLDVNFLQATAGACEPFVHYGSAACRRLMDEVTDRFLPGHHIDAVVLSLQWRPADAAQLPALASKLTRNGAALIVFGPNQTYTLPYPEVVARALYARDRARLSRFNESGVDTLDVSIGRTARAVGARYVSVRRTMCTPECLALAKDGVPVTADYDHLSASGSISLAQRLPADLLAPTVVPRERDGPAPQAPDGSAPHPILPSAAQR